MFQVLFIRTASAATRRKLHAAVHAGYKTTHVDACQHVASRFFADHIQGQTNGNNGDAVEDTKPVFHTAETLQEHQKRLENQLQQELPARLVEVIPQMEEFILHQLQRNQGGFNIRKLLREMAIRFPTLYGKSIGFLRDEHLNLFLANMEAKEIIVRPRKHKGRIVLGRKGAKPAPLMYTPEDWLIEKRTTLK
jgi:hypothetical protein